MKKHRTLYEGPEWDESRKKVDPKLPRFEEAFRFVSYNIAIEPRMNSTAFLGDDHRILVNKIPGVADLWIYFRIEPGDNSCTLLWIQSQGEQVPFRVG